LNASSSAVVAERRIGFSSFLFPTRCGSSPCDWPPASLCGPTGFFSTGCDVSRLIPPRCPLIRGPPADMFSAPMAPGWPASPGAPRAAWPSGLEAPRRRGRTRHEAFMAPASLASSPRGLKIGKLDDLVRRQAFQSRTPPLITQDGFAREESRSPLAARRVALHERAGEGPTSKSFSSPAMPASVAAILVSVFLPLRTCVLAERTAQFAQLGHGKTAVVGQHAPDEFWNPLRSLSADRSHLFRHGPCLASLLIFPVRTVAEPRLQRVDGGEGTIATRGWGGRGARGAWGAGRRRTGRGAIRPPNESGLSSGRCAGARSCGLRSQRLAR